jgi:hypothetical protein
MRIMAERVYIRKRMNRKGARDAKNIATIHETEIGGSRLPPISVLM